MRKWALLLLLLFTALLAAPAAAQEKAESVELVGQIGSRSALLVLHSTQREDGSWHMTGEYIVFPTFARRFLDGERSPQLGVATFKEGTSAILFGRPATGELRGTYREGEFRGTRYGPGGQERERFEFSERFPSMERYSAEVSCEAGDARYASTLSYAVESGKPKGALEWRSRVQGENHQCVVRADAVRTDPNGLALAQGACTVRLRDIGDYVKVAAENCAAQCGSGAYLEPLVVDRRGHCNLLRPEPR